MKKVTSLIGQRPDLDGPPPAGPLRVVVSTHTMEIGGSQLNAIELAATIAEMGHELIIYGEEGPLLDRVQALGLEHVRQDRSPVRPSLKRSHHLAGLIRERGINVVHGFEWPPILEAYAAKGLVGGVTVVGTVNSMSVPPFLPSRMPLIVCTERIRMSVPPRPGPLRVVETPVDTRHNRPGVGAAEFREQYPVPPGTLSLVLVSRLVPELKLEGILTAVRAMRVLSDRGTLPPMRLTIVGGGDAAPEVLAASAAANAGLAEPVVVLAGEHRDPRGAYASADIMIGMGGSAMRALAFAKPLVVQGEVGFFDILDESTLPVFMDQGFYGRGDRGPDEAVERLIELLGRLAGDPAHRARLGEWGRELVEQRFSMTAAARSLVEVYREGQQLSPSRSQWVTDGLRPARELLAYKLRRRRDARHGVAAKDDFNANPA